MVSQKTTAKQLRDRIAAGQVKSSEATGRIFESIEKYDKKLGTYISTFKQQALEQAKKVDEKIAAGQSVGQLAGVPVAIKDNMCTTFGFTTCASKILGNFKSPY